MTFTKTIARETQGFSDILDLTEDVKSIVSESGMQEGIACISVVGSTASITTIEFEPALVQDFKDKLEEFWSEGRMSRHSQTWGDDNGFSHIRASMMGPSVCLPFSKGAMVLGTWQQIVLVDHDNRPRSRELFVQLVGE